MTGSVFQWRISSKSVLILYETSLSQFFHKYINGKIVVR